MNSLLQLALNFFSPLERRESLSLDERGLSSWGGFPLLETPCPNGTSTCSSTYCCPTGTICNSKSVAAMCCPTSKYYSLLHYGILWHWLTMESWVGDDCSANVQTLVACADNSWELYEFGGYFCCTADSVGTESTTGGKRCIAKNLPVPASITLTEVRRLKCSSRYSHC
jgi:hypothetical protein